MKNVLIAGANSYVGTSIADYLLKRGGYSVSIMDMKGDLWRSEDFHGFDSVIFVAGIVHCRENTENADLYFKVNCDLAVEAAKKAKESGVSQFIYLSSMSVYGLKSGVITKSTPAVPVNNYGKSKLLAETRLSQLEGGGFCVALLRPPMIYGKNCPGNFGTLVKLAKKMRVFPKCRNRRSMLYIGNLCVYVARLIENGASGVFFPQNPEYVNTSEMVCKIAESLGKKIFLSRLLGLAVCLMRLFSSKAQKAFGSLIYVDMEPRLDGDNEDFEKTVEMSV